MSLMNEQNLECDVLVFDSSSSGIGAAIAAARGGCAVILITEDRHVGGMQSSGLGWTNTGMRETIGGIAREFHRRVLDYYVSVYGKESDQVRVCGEGFHFEPHVAEGIFERWLEEAGVRVMKEEVVVGVEKEGEQLVAVRTESGKRISAKAFIDASYEGDLMKLAGCSYRVGRESREEYGEELAGVRWPAGMLGKADEKTQAYDYRLCLTNVPENRVAFRRPGNYDPANYAWFAQRMRDKPPVKLHEALPINPMPNGKTDSRTGEWPGGSWAYPEADRATRRKIAQAHREYSAGYVWFLLHDAPVPAFIREELSQWGHANDEFVDNDHWPYHMYVREARRLVGEHVMTQRDVTTDRFKADGVALGSFYLDVHAVQTIATERGLVAEGGIGADGRVWPDPYEISYRALLAKRGETSNLLVTVCLSASHIGYSTIRMEPVYTMLGHAAGTAAAMSVRERSGVHELNMGKLRQRLVDEGQIIDARPFKRAR